MSVASRPAHSGAEVASRVEPMEFEPPGPGSWMLDTTHHGRRPLTPFIADGYLRAFEAGFAVMAERFGMPLQGMRAATVNGYFYVRPVPLGERGKVRPAPPAPVMWLVSRLHPQMRQRTKAAAQAWEQQAWRQDVDRWFEHDRARVVDTNLQFQAVDPAQEDNEGLAAHLELLMRHHQEQFVAGFVTHGGDIVPVGDFLAHCDRWGVPAGEAARLLAGASPATVETRRILAPAARAIEQAAATPASVGQARDLTAGAAAAIDRWLELHAWRLLIGDDIDSPTLAEQPRLQLGILTNIELDEPEAATVDPAGVRDRVPARERDKFDELLASARYGLTLRDDNVGVRVNWPGGLVRRAVLEAGLRLAGAGMLHSKDDVFCLQPNEALGLLRQRRGPSADTVAERMKLHRLRLAQDPPLQLGEPESPPPVEVLPAPMGRMTAAVMSLIGAMQGSAAETALTGTGVGGSAYTGRACLISSPDDDLDRLRPGDVLIAPFTSPSFNSVLPLVGAMAAQEGGLLSHTAIVAREFGIPAVVGVAGLLSEIIDGETVEVDPTAGIVRPVDR